MELAQLTEMVEPARVEAALVHGIQQAAATDWRAAAWTLEQRYPERWGEKAHGLDADLEED
jgi:hypothetical protein